MASQQKFTNITGTGAHVLDDECRKVTILVINDAEATLAVGGAAPILPNGIPITFEDRNLAGTTLTFGGTINNTISVFEELGAGA